MYLFVLAKKYLQFVLVYKIIKKYRHFFSTSLDGVIEPGISSDTTSSEMYPCAHFSLGLWNSETVMYIMNSRCSFLLSVLSDFNANRLRVRRVWEKYYSHIFEHTGALRLTLGRDLEFRFDPPAPWPSVVNVLIKKTKKNSKK